MSGKRHVAKECVQAAAFHAPAFCFHPCARAASEPCRFCVRKRGALFFVAVKSQCARLKINSTAACATVLNNIYKSNGDKNGNQCALCLAGTANTQLMRQNTLRWSKRCIRSGMSSM